MVSSASALVITPFCKLSRPYSVGLGSTRRWTSAVLGARSRASSLLVAREAGTVPVVGEFSRQHRATRSKGCGASRERGWVFRHILSNLGQRICNYRISLRRDADRTSLHPYHLQTPSRRSAAEATSRSWLRICVRRRFRSQPEPAIALPSILATQRSSTCLATRA